MIVIQRLLWFVGLVLLQVLVLNNVHIGAYASPFLYTYFLLALDADCTRSETLLWGFAIGLAVDIFSNTPGLNASATTVLALAREPLLRSQAPRDAAEDFSPSIRTMGFAPYFRYIFAAVLLHITVLQMLDFFTFSRPLPLLWRILSDAALTLVCMLCIDFMRRKR